MSYNVYHNPHTVTLGATPITGVIAVTVQQSYGELHAAADSDAHESVAVHTTGKTTGSIILLDPVQAQAIAGAPAPSASSGPTPPAAATRQSPSPAVHCPAGTLLSPATPPATRRLILSPPKQTAPTPSPSRKNPSPFYGGGEGVRVLNPSPLGEGRVRVL